MPLDINSVYGKARNMAGDRIGSFSRHKAILLRAVGELSAINIQRGAHIRFVAEAMHALSTRDPNFFTGNLRQEEKAVYEIELQRMFNAYARLTPQIKELLELTALGHDLGIPFGIEWDHHLNGAMVARELIKKESVAIPLATLIEHHGETSNLTSSSFPRDILSLPRDLRIPLVLFDFCDATARSSPDGKTKFNPVGLLSLRFYTGLLDQKTIEELMDPLKLFDLRWRYAFAPILFNKSLTEQDRQAAFSRTEPAKLIAFFGSRFRCFFFDMLLKAVTTEDPSASSEAIGDILATIIQTAENAQMSGDVLLSPDTDLGRALQINDKKNVLLAGLKRQYDENGLASLLEARPNEGKIVFKSSLLMK